MSDLIAVAVVDLKAGAALDWAVAKALGKEVSFSLGFCNPFSNDGEHTKFSCFSFTDSVKQRLYEPSTSWAQGGKIIDQGCGLFHCGAETGAGTFWTCSFGTYPELRSQTGSTALEAACRAIVAAKFGDAVTVPRELVTAE